MRFPLIVSLMSISGTAEKLDLDCILTVRNVGYKWSENETNRFYLQRFLSIPSQF